MVLLEMVKAYQALLETKDALAEQAKANNAAIEAAKAEIAQQMVGDDCLDFLDTLREEGLGDIIVEKVDPRTLQSTVKAYVEEHGELSEGLDAIIKTFEYNDVTRRKETGRKAK